MMVAAYTIISKLMCLDKDKKVLDKERENWYNSFQLNLRLASCLY